MLINGDSWGSKELLWIRKDAWGFMGICRDSSEFEWPSPVVYRSREGVAKKRRVGEKRRANARPTLFNVGPTLYNLFF